MNKTELARKIKALEGLDNEEKAALLDLLRRQKKYGLVWEEKTEDIEERLHNELPVLIERNDDKVHSIISDNPDAPNHLIIEGDNLAALTELSYTHAGKIDVIYIDPPYNTGNKDFSYYDDFLDEYRKIPYVEKEDSFRHSKWLSFISKRLKISKMLLSEFGVIFISIDDNEYANLKILADEIFGVSNCLSTLVWDLGAGTSAGHFTRAHEYILVYCKNREKIANFSGGEGIIDDRAIKKLSAKNHEFEYTFKAGTKCEAADGFELSGEWGESEKTKLIRGRFLCQGGQLVDDVTLSACWTQKNQMDSFFSGKPTFDSKGQRVIEFYFRDNGKLYCRKQRDKINPPSVLRGIATTKQGSSILKDILGDSVFDFPKPPELIKFLLSLRQENASVLDFFAGSGTTLHAVMQLNADDGGKRTCTLCTNNENGICENVTYERNKRVIEGYTKPNGEEVAGLTDNNLRYYRTEFIPRERSVKNMRDLVQASTGLLCIKNNLYTEAPFAGKKLNSQYARFFEHRNNRMLIIYEEQAIPFIADIIKTMPKGDKIKVYVFSHGSYAYDDEFDEVADRVTLCALPQAIYDAYQRVLPKHKPKFFDNNIIGDIAGSEIQETEGLFAINEEGGDE
ncbi:MAG: site-specific DNA-methyltransferase [Muribaculaceae bacterium]|nr:site-specific DNA-methyltransferase [Muribaculaceae bacterium]